MADGGGGAVSVLIGSGTGSFATAVPYTVGTSPQGVVAADFDGDQDLDLAVANGGGGVSVLVGAGNGTFASQPLLGAGSSPTALVTADFNGDSDPDLAVANSGSDNVSILLGGSGTTFSGPTNVAAGASPLGIAAGDFDGNQDPDLAVSNFDANNGTVSILLGGANASFSSPTPFAAGAAPNGVTAADFNGDGDPDLAVAAANANDVSVLLGGTGGSFSAVTAFAADEVPTDVATGDFNGDGHLDLAVSNRLSGKVSVLIGGAGGQFEAPANLTAGDWTTGITTADLDGDGDPDIAAANRDSNNVTVLLDTTDTRAPETTIAAGPPAYTNQATATFTFSADEASATFECRVDGAAFSPCTSPLTTDPQGEGAHVFEVRAVDTSGNVDATPARQSFIVDTIAPVVAVSGPAQVTPGQPATFVASVTDAGGVDPAAVQWTATGGLPAQSGTSVKYTFSAAGAYALRVQATDRAGNVSVPAAQAVSVTFLLTQADLVRTLLLHPGRYAIVQKLRVVRAAAGMTIRVGCKGKGCPKKLRKSLTKRVRKAGTVELKQLFKRARLRVGARLQVQLLQPGLVGKVFTFKIRRRTIKSTGQCLLPGAKKPSACPK